MLWTHNATMGGQIAAGTHLQRFEQLDDAGKHLQAQTRVAYVLFEIRVHRRLQLGQLAHRLQQDVHCLRRVGLGR